MLIWSLIIQLVSQVYLHRLNGIRVKTESTNGNTTKRDAMINDGISFLSEILSQVHWNKQDQTRFIDNFSKRSFNI